MITSFIADIKVQIKDNGDIIYYALFEDYTGTGKTIEDAVDNLKEVVYGE